MSNHALDHGNYMHGDVAAGQESLGLHIDMDIR